MTGSAKLPGLVVEDDGEGRHGDYTWLNSPKWAGHAVGCSKRSAKLGTAALRGSGRITDALSSSVRLKTIHPVHAIDFQKVTVY